MASYAFIEVSGGLGRIVMSREDRLNALGREMIRSLVKLVDEAESSREVKVVSLTGRGRLFSAGIDLKEAAGSGGPDEASGLFEELVGLFSRLAQLSKPFIIELNGDAYGGGAELIWTADIVVSVRGARLVWPEARWGLSPPLLPVIGPSVLGPSRAAYLALTGSSLAAEEAYRLGLISRVYDTLEEMREGVAEIARSIVENSPRAVKSIKSLLRAAKLALLADLGSSELLRLSAMEEARNAWKAFLRKERPVYEW